MKEFEQAKDRYQNMTQEEKESFINNVTESLMFEEEAVRQKVLEYLGRVDTNLGKILRKRLSF